MINTTQTTVRDIALAAPATTRVFEEFKIDYCCGGRRSIADVCAASGIDQAVLEKRLDEVMSRDASAEKFPENMAPAELIGHILDSHHVFTKAELARLAPLMQKVVTRHGEHHPELSELGQIFEALRASLEPHMMKEENVLFPYIQRLCSGLPVPPPPFGTVKNPIRMMMIEHDTDGERLAEMRRITSDYRLPAEACPSFTALYAGLQDLERDLHQHIHLENNVLFPAAAELEN